MLLVWGSMWVKHSPVLVGTRAVLRLVWPLISSLVMSMMTLKCSFNYPEHNIINVQPLSILRGIIYNRPGAIPTPESESNDDSDPASGVGIGIICSSFWWSRNRGDWNRNRGDWNRSWNRNQMTILHIYVHGTI